MNPDKRNSAFRCDSCNAGFSKLRALRMHYAAKHEPQRCSLCDKLFANRGELGLHKIKIHSYTRQKLGWGLTVGRNRGLSKAVAFPNAKETHGTAEFMRYLNNPEMLKRKKITRLHHEAMVLRKELELRAQGFRTFCTSNYMRHNRVPDVIAIAPNGKVIAIELESMHRYKDSIEMLRKRYTSLLLEEGFFEDVVVEGFLKPNAESSNT